MATGLRGRGRASGREERACPVCMEHTKNNWFSFPCGHSVCAECDEKMLARRFLSCPTCRTPREGVSERQVEAANQARVDMHARQDDGWEEDMPSVGRYGPVMFFPDESGGANPFGVLTNAIGSPLSAPSAPMPEDEDEALAQTLQAEEMVGAHLPLTRTTSVRTAVQGPMRDLVDRLLSPAPISEFLAQREVVRRQARHRLARAPTQYH